MRVVMKHLASRVALMLWAVSSAVAADSLVLTASIERPVDSIALRQVSRILDRAAERHAELVILRLDTPGGTLGDAQEIVQLLLQSPVPVTVYVAPAGASAKGAGLLLAAAASIHAMAPAARIGAVQLQPQGITEDVRSFLRAIAEARGRPAQSLEQMVTRGRLYTAQEAVGAGVADLEARDMGELLRAVNGRTVPLPGGDRRLDTSRVRVEELGPLWGDRVLSALAQPNLAFLMLFLGAALVVVELLSPGFVGPGAVGLILLVLGLTGMGHLPVNWLGVLLILGAMVFFYLELQAPGFSLPGVAALLCLAAGGYLVFDGFRGNALGSFRLSLWLVSGTVALLGGALALFLYFLRTGGGSAGFLTKEEGALIGLSGLADTDLVPVGEVWVGNAKYTATTSLGQPIRAGEPVKVVGVYGDVLKVEHASEGAGERWQLP